MRFSLVVANGIWLRVKLDIYHRCMNHGNHHCPNHEWQHRPNFYEQHMLLYFVQSLDLHNQPIIRSFHFHRANDKHRYHNDWLDHVEYAMVDVLLSNESCLGLVKIRILLDSSKILEFPFEYQLVLDFQPEIKSNEENRNSVKINFIICYADKNSLQELVEHQFWLNQYSIAMSDRVLEWQQ